MSLSKKQKKILSTLLSNEVDPCFYARALTVFDFLDLQENDTVLDCGCGRGFYLNMARSISNCTLTGCDSNDYDQVIDVAKKELKGKNISIVEANVLQGLPFADNSFDKIIFSEVIEHLPDDTAGLKELFRVLKPGGVLAVTTPNQRYPFLWDPINYILETLLISPIRTGIFSGIWAHHERLYKRELLEQQVTSCGFSLIETKLLTYICFPFAHNLIYGIGKELLLRGVLPTSLATAADRFSYEKNKGTFLNPINVMRKLFFAIDRLNDLFPTKKSSVTIALKLRK